MALCLVVDDDPMACKVAASVAGSMGFEVRTQPDGLSAINFCGEHMPDLIILDLQMPRMDGLAFLRDLHRKIGGRRPYVIACTAMSDSETVKSLQNEGVQAYLVKPFEVEALKKKISASKIL